MKVLYITDHRQIAASGGFVSDYLNDLTFFGLKEVLGDGVIDSVPIISLYKQYKPHIDQRWLWGGMTAFWLLNDDTQDRGYIPEKISDKYYDLIIYGSIQRCQDYYDVVSQAYDPKKVILLDGNDERFIHPLAEKHLCFKRELVYRHQNLLPISFSFPTPHLNIPTRNKTQHYGTVIPGDKSTYVFTTEKAYYQDYHQSFYGVTAEKAGWDCMRHYEIMGNYCLPYFKDLENCPPDILFNFPKDLIVEGTALSDRAPFDAVKYYEILDRVYEHFQQNLTTKAMATYLLNKVA